MKPVIALIGRPNVGKSTLFNQITKSRDALVVDICRAPAGALQISRVVMHLLPILRGLRVTVNMVMPFTKINPLLW